MKRKCSVRCSVRCGARCSACWSLSRSRSLSHSRGNLSNLSPFSSPSLLLFLPPPREGTHTELYSDGAEFLGLSNELHALHSLVHVQHLNQQKLMTQIADAVLGRDSVEGVVTNAFASGAAAKAAGPWARLQQKVANGSGIDELKKEQAVNAIQVTPVEDEMRI